MKFFSTVAVLVGVAATALAQTIELAYPTDGTVLTPGQNITAQIVQPESMASCIQVGIALALNACENGVCPDPAQELGAILYAGPWTPTGHQVGGFYQNFSVSIPMFLQGAGPGIFSLTHLCLLGGGPAPFLEYRNASVTIA
ncbi:hypothetical protein BJ138DRAFT_1121895 [Hygrophoropsis aurantiaca]|uniref:Uncharacterized protein n=1 Tax=Hygrophoropsis aurantiaca TaxID=72124 RepID=A0ACB8ART6_9AGAM|nr:hypothetical protein BJ138DRAFT_1121895 [Hygrophoropsis aurantiaca]